MEYKSNFDNPPESCGPARTRVQMIEDRAHWWNELAQSAGAIEDARKVLEVAHNNRLITSDEMQKASEQITDVLRLMERIEF